MSDHVTLPDGWVLYFWREFKNRLAQAAGGHLERCCFCVSHPTDALATAAVWARASPVLWACCCQHGACAFLTVCCQRRPDIIERSHLSSGKAPAQSGLGGASLCAERRGTGGHAGEMCFENAIVVTVLLFLSWFGSRWLFAPTSKQSWGCSNSKACRFWSAVGGFGPQSLTAYSIGGGCNWFYVHKLFHEGYARWRA